MDYDDPEQSGEEIDQAYELAKTQELRIECKDSGDLNVRLDDGTAEIFGAELVKGVSVNVAGQKVAVFTWTGCKLHIQGRRPDIVYVADDTPMVSYMNFHKTLNNRRQQALQEGKRGPHCIILGPTDSGKSTLTRMLCNWAVRSGWQPTMVDLDIGQGSITVPGCIAATPIESPVDCEEGYPLEMPLVFFFGHASPSDNPELYKFLVERLSAVLDRRAEANAQAKASGLIINTLGWVDGLGYELQMHAVAALKTDVVAVLEQDRLFNQVTNELKGQDISVVKLTKSGGVVKRERDERKNARDRRIREYFYGSAGNPLAPSHEDIQAKHLMVYKIGGVRRAPSSALPIGAMSSADPLRLSNEAVDFGLIQSLLAVSHAPSPDQVLSTNIAGFILVKNVDSATGVVNYLSPCPVAPGQLPGRYLVTGSIRCTLD